MDYDTNTPVLGETTDTYILDLVGNGIATAVTEPSNPLLLGMELLVFGFMRRKTAA